MSKETRDCPFCGEEILAVAKKCKHCGEFLDETLRPVRHGKHTGPEQELWKGNPSVLYYVHYWILGAIVVALGLALASRWTASWLLVAIGVWAILYSILDRNMKVFTVSTHRVVARSGIVSRKTQEVSIADIRSVSMNQPVLERMCGLGTIGIGSAGTAGLEVSFVGIKNPAEVRDLVRRMKDQVGA